VISVRIIVLAVTHNSGDTVSLRSEWSKVKFRLVHWRKTFLVRWCNFYYQRALLLCHIYSDFGSSVYCNAILRIGEKRAMQICTKRLYIAHNVYLNLGQRAGGKTDTCEERTHFKYIRVRTVLRTSVSMSFFSFC
jgi:hypothetical protein